MIKAIILFIYLRFNFYLDTCKRKLNIENICLLLSIWCLHYVAASCFDFLLYSIIFISDICIINTIYTINNKNNDFSFRYPLLTRIKSLNHLFQLPFCFLHTCKLLHVMISQYNGVSDYFYIGYMCYYYFYDCRYKVLCFWSLTRMRASCFLDVNAPGNRHLLHTSTRYMNLGHFDASGTNNQT